MCRPSWPVSIGPRLEVSLKDRFQNEQQRTLDHTVPDRRNQRDADFPAAVLRDLLLPVRHGYVLARAQLVSDLPNKAVHSPFLDGLEGDPVNSRGSVVLLGQAVGFLERLFLADVDVQAPKTPRRFGLRLGVDLPSQVLQTHKRCCHPPLPSFLEQSTYSMATSLHGRYPASPLLWAHPTPSRLRSASRLSAGCTVYLSPSLPRRDEEGFTI